jgi:hypothetical protein
MVYDVLVWSMMYSVRYGRMVWSMMYIVWYEYGMQYDVWSMVWSMMYGIWYGWYVQPTNLTLGVWYLVWAYGRIGGWYVHPLPIPDSCTPLLLRS